MIIRRPTRSGRHTGWSCTCARAESEAAAKRHQPGWRARRWVVERTGSWLNRFRRLLVRWEKKAANYSGMLNLACACITFQQAGLFG